MNAAARSGSRPASVLATLYAAYLLSFADRVLFSLSLQSIKATFGFSEGQLGLLAGVAFAISYALFSPIAGWLADRRSRKWVLVAAVLLWSAATLATALATSLATMFAARALVGAGEAAVMPLAVSLLGDAYDPARRARAYAIFLSAGAAGTMLALLFGGALMATVGGWGGVTLPVVGTVAPWQSLFCAAGTAGIVFAALIAALFREPTRPGNCVTAEPAVASGSLWAFVRANPGLVATIYLGLSFFQMATVTTVTWIVAAVSRAHAMTPAATGQVVGAFGGAALLVGCIAGGVAIGRLRARGLLAAPLLACLGGSLLFAALMIAGLLTAPFVPAITLMATGLLFAYLPTTAAFTMMGEAVPAPIRARLAGFNTMSNAVICNSLGAWLVGILTDRVFAGPDATARSLATVIALGVLVGTAIALAGLPAYRRRVRAAAAARQ